MAGCSIMTQNQPVFIRRSGYTFVLNISRDYFSGARRQLSLPNKLTFSLSTEIDLTLYRVTIDDAAVFDLHVICFECNHKLIAVDTSFERIASKHTAVCAVKISLILLDL